MEKLSCVPHELMSEDINFSIFHFIKAKFLADF